MSILPNFRHNKNFPEKMGSVSFILLLNPKFMQKIRKKTMMGKLTDRQVKGQS